MASNIIMFEDIFVVDKLDPDGKKFDKVTRVEARSHNLEMFMQLDVNTEVYPMAVGDKFTLAMAPTLNLDGTPDTGYFTPGAKKTLADKYEYIMHGKLYKITERDGKTPKALDKYAISKYAESFEFVPKTLADNAGLNAMEIIASLYTGNTKLGIDLEEGTCKDVSESKVWDLIATKLFALKYASDAACTVLCVDKIIMAKQAGGPNRAAAQSAGAGGDED